MAIEFNNEYISIVMEANLSTPDEIKQFIEDSDEACNIRMPAVVLDMKNVREINSAGIAKILKLYKNLQSLKVKLFMINLDDSVIKFEEGMKISKECNKMLENAEKKITILLNDENGEKKEENFETE